MRTALGLAVVWTLFWGMYPPLHAEETVVDKFTAFANSELALLASDPVIVAAVKAQNSMGRSLDWIKDQDRKWRKEPGINAFMESLINSPCGKHLQALQASEGVYAEIFVMDNQGANVCLSKKTSDYWQGDEEKFQKSFLNGVGAVYVGEVKFDESTQAYLSQISLPVKADGKVIGAVTFGIDVVPLSQKPPESP